MSSNRGSARVVVIALLALLIGLVVLWRWLSTDTPAQARTSGASATTAATPPVEAEDEELTEEEQSLVDADDATRESEASLPTIAALRGAVTNAEGKPIERNAVPGMDADRAAARMRKPLITVTARRKVGKRLQATIDEKGNYAFPKLVRGKWTIEASALDHEPVTATIVVDGRETKLVHDFRLQSRRALEVRVRVTNVDALGAQAADLAGSPLAVRLATDAAIVIASEPLETLPQPLAVDGEKIVELAAFGRAERASSDWIYSWKLAAPSSGQVALALQGTLVEARPIRFDAPVTFELDAARVLAGLASLRVQIVDATNDRPLAGAQLRLARTAIGESSADAGEERVLEVARTGDDGKVELTGLTPGDATLLVRANGYAPLDVPVSLAAGKTLELAPQRLSGAVAIHGRVVDAEGKPLGAPITVLVRCVREGSSSSDSTRTVNASAQGFELRELGRHKYLLVAETSDQRFAPTREVDATMGDVKDVELKLAPGVAVTLDVTRGATQPFELEVVDARGVAMFHRGSTGATTLNLALPAGAYTARARFQGKVIAERAFTVESNALSARLDVP